MLLYFIGNPQTKQQQQKTTTLKCLTMSMSVYAYPKSQVVYWFAVEFLVELCFDAVKIT